MQAPTSTAGYAGSLRIRVGHDADHGYHREAKVPKREALGSLYGALGSPSTVGATGTRVAYEPSWATVRTIGTPGKRRYRKRSAGITVRTVGIANYGRYCREHGNKLRIHCDHGTNRKISMGMVVNRGFVHPTSGHNDGVNRDSCGRVR
ncbi:hypothetical protein ACLKA7_005093 [Drosophila subpalustris]